MVWNAKESLFLQVVQKKCYTEDSEYWYKVLAETLFRIDYLKEKDCSCIGCKKELQELEEFLPKIKKHLI